MNPAVIQRRDLELGLGAGTSVGASCLVARGGNGVTISASSDEASGNTARKACVNSEQVL